MFTVSRQPELYSKIFLSPEEEEEEEEEGEEEEEVVMVVVVIFQLRKGREEKEGKLSPGHIYILKPGPLCLV